jgi:4-amino-4-deoxy-L-arabinose transferase-like glycosyltransferase
MPGQVSAVLRRLDPVVVGAVLVGVAIRVAALVAKLGDPIPFSDATWYSDVARALREGAGFTDLATGGPTAEHGPLTPLVLAPVSSGGFANNQRILMTVLGVAGLVLFALVAWRMLSPTAARVAVVVAAVYPNIWMHNPIVMSETVATLLIVLALWLLLRQRDAASWRWALGLGVVTGLAALARSELVLLVPLYGALAAWFAARQARTGPLPAPSRPLATFVLVGATGLAVISPWMAANLTRFEEPVVLTTNDGTTWLGANCEDTYDGPTVGSWSLLCVLGHGAPAGADPSERSRIWRDAAFEYAGDNTGRIPVVVAARVGRMLDVYDPSSMIEGDALEDKPTWALWAGVGMWWVLAPLAVLGLAVMPRDDRWMLLPPIAIVLLTTVVFYGGHRLRNPLEVPVVLAAAYGVAWLVGRSRATRERAAADSAADEHARHPAPTADAVAR